MIARGHNDVKFSHYFVSNRFKPRDTLFARFLRDSEKPPSYLSRVLFKDMRSTPLHEAVVDGKDVCLHSLPEPPSEVVIAMKLPPTMRVQLDSCTKDNKSRYILHIGRCWLRKAFSRRCLCPFFFWPHA